MRDVVCVYHYLGLNQQERLSHALRCMQSSGTELLPDVLQTQSAAERFKKQMMKQMSNFVSQSHLLLTCSG